MKKAPSRIAKPTGPIPQPITDPLGRIRHIREAAAAFEAVVNTCLPSGAGRECSIATTHIQTACLWAVQGVDAAVARQVPGTTD